VGWLDAIGERSPWELPFVAPARALEARCHQVLGDRDEAARCWREVVRWYDGGDGLAADAALAAARALSLLEVASA
jgi:hypothetical protein